MLVIRIWCLPKPANEDHQMWTEKSQQDNLLSKQLTKIEYVLDSRWFY